MLYYIITHLTAPTVDQKALRLIFLTGKTEKNKQKNKQKRKNTKTVRICCLFFCRFTFSMNT